MYKRKNNPCHAEVFCNNILTVSTLTPAILCTLLCMSGLYKSSHVETHKGCLHNHLVTWQVTSWSFCLCIWVFIYLSHVKQIVLCQKWTGPDPTQGSWLEIFLRGAGMMIASLPSQKERSTPPGSEPNGALPSSNMVTEAAPSRETCEQSGARCVAGWQLPGSSAGSAALSAPGGSQSATHVFMEKEREPGLAELHKSDSFKTPLSVTPNKPKFLKHWESRWCVCM